MFKNKSQKMAIFKKNDKSKPKQKHINRKARLAMKEEASNVVSESDVSFKMEPINSEAESESDVKITEGHSSDDEMTADRNVEMDSSSDEAEDVVAENNERSSKGRKPQGEITEKKPRDNSTYPANVRTIYVGNIPLGVTEEDLKSQFSVFGEIEQISLHNLPSEEVMVFKIKRNGERIRKPSSITFYAFIVFKNEEDAKAATAKNGDLIEANHIRVKMANDDPNDPPHLTVFLSRLPKRVKENDIWNFFGDEMKLKGVKIIRDAGKVCAFVLLESEDDVALALKKNETEIKGQVVFVKPRIPLPLAKEKDAKVESTLIRKKGSNNTPKSKNEGSIEGKKKRKNTEE